MTQSLADAHGITLLKCAENDGLPEIKTDPLRFKQILLNLMSNAIKYNRDDGEVVIDCQKIPGAYLRISVTDQGPGIPADQFDNVFEPFNRAGAEYAEVPGTGIGLAIAKQMVELMGDEIGLESKVGEGTTFWFTAPVAAETASSVST
jgi:signal transduction histidine kinase